MTEPSFEQSQASMRPHEDPVSLPKIFLISSLALATLVPTFFVSGLIAEREARQGVVQSEFTRNWGPPQELRSPTLVVPYQSAPDRPRGYLKITPDRLSVTANLTPQERKRGLFHATVYDAKVEMQGVFVLPTEARLRGVLSGRPLWNESFIALSTTSLTGLRSEDQITVDGTETPWRPCAESAGLEWDCKSASLILASAPVAAAASSVSFQATISLRGTGAFNLLYAGKQLDASMRSPWRTPSFGGSILPENASVTSQGFDAHWQTTAFGSPPISIAGGISRSGHVERRDHRRRSDRGHAALPDDQSCRQVRAAVRRAVVRHLFLLRAVVAPANPSRAICPARAVAFAVLIAAALAERADRVYGRYIVSAALVLAQSSLYTAAVARRVAPTLVFVVVQACLFAFIYVLLDLETYSLLIGALALFAVVSALMVLTQRVNWSAQPSVSFN